MSEPSRLQLTTLPSTTYYLPSTTSPPTNYSIHPFPRHLFNRHLNSLYDAYIKAFRWASDRLDPAHGGIIGFVSNGSWLDGNGIDGFRKCLEGEFSSIYVYNLRGNQQTSGELSRKEGGKIFGSDSRTPVAITILVKRGTGGKNEIK